MIYRVILPILLMFVPWVATRFVFVTARSRRVPYRKYAPYLWAAAALWLIGFWLPNISFGLPTTSFSLHTAGGVAAGFLWLYTVNAYGVRFSAWWHAPLSLYLLVSGLGALNELFEILLNATGLEPVYNLDAQWDILANTLGAMLFYLGWLVVRTRK